MMVFKVLAAAAAVIFIVLGVIYYNGMQSKNRLAEIQADMAAPPTQLVKVEPTIKDNTQPLQLKADTKVDNSGGVVVASDEELFSDVSVNVNQRAAKRLPKAPDSNIVKDKAKLDNIRVRWNDAMKVALSTSRIQLNPAIQDLQSIKLDVLNMNVEPCLEAPKARLAKAMGIFIDGLLEFKSNTNIGVFLFEDYAEKANKDMEAYDVWSQQCVTMM